MRIHCLQHVAHEGPGTLREWAALHGYHINFTMLFEADPTWPDESEFDLLLVMGGFMNVDEEQKFPWLKKEKEFIKESLQNDKQVVGICLGAQLLASALGKPVYPGSEKEIGFFSLHFHEDALNHPLFKHFAAIYPAFHWHGDTFDLPEGAQLIASTEVCKNQAFVIEKEQGYKGAVAYKALALQFHLEMDEQGIEAMMETDGEELKQGGALVQSADEIRKGYDWLSTNCSDLFILMDKFIGL